MARERTSKTCKTPRFEVQNEVQMHVVALQALFLKLAYSAFTNHKAK